MSQVKLAILPVVKTDGLGEKARKIFNDLKFDFACQYDEKDAIGRRYRRQDAIGTPYCITIDYDTLNDDSVTVRYRDSMEQKRVKIDELKNEMKQELDVAKLLKTL